jgi:aspartyl-tRNA synthetase
MRRTFIAEAIPQVGSEVLLKGWVHVRRNLGKVVFFELRDMTGLMQVVVSSDATAATRAAAQAIRPEYVVAVRGVVRARKPGAENPKLPSGHVEVAAAELNTISAAETPPFEIENEDHRAAEELRLTYRYLDLRHERLQRILTLRHEVLQFTRRFLSARGFREVETPVLGKSTPEGARDYLVPARAQPGKFYALPQSPQQYKQLLMVAGVERYFQIVRCFRDEDTRADRQPEFTQLDIEMSFVEEEDVLALVEQLYVELVSAVAPTKRLSQVPFPRLTYADAMRRYGTDKPDLRQHPSDPNELAFAFVTHFPMFERKEDGSLGAVHHPFTKPRAASAAALKAADPLNVLAHQYDFVLNGYEVAGGSIRTHDPALLQAVFETLGYSAADVRAQFGHLLDAFRYGVPPHGGIAPGIDRLVMLLAGEENIREVIAFPKTADGRDLMVGAPAAVDDAQLRELHLRVVP